MSPEPYISILKEEGYLLDGTEIGNPVEDEVYYDMYFSYNGTSHINLCLIGEGEELVNKFLSSKKDNNDLKLLRIYDITVIEGDYEDSPDTIRFFETSLIDNELFNVYRITPDCFKKLIEIRKKPRLEHCIYLIRRYLYYYDNVILPIVEPVTKFKNLTGYCSLFDYNITTNNQNIEIIYTGNNRQFQQTSFTLGIDYITGKLYFYVNPNDIIFDFADKVNTKGKFKELLKKYEI